MSSSIMLSHIIAEIIFIVLFAVTAVLAYKKKRLDFIIYAVVFALIFENINIWLLRNSADTYSYSSSFHCFIFYVPLWIALGWAVLLYLGYSATQKIKLPYQRAAIAALIPLAIDILLDPIAIRLKFWTWGGFSLQEGFFGVPANNFIGWFIVSYIFILFYLLVKKKKKEKKKWLIPILEYIFFFIVMSIVLGVEVLLRMSKQMEFIMMPIVIIGAFIIAEIVKDLKKK